eukprot:COSAG02_NODE_51972_length_310_cov_19.502370_1_plen_80_part_10
MTDWYHLKLYRPCMWSQHDDRISACYHEIPKVLSGCGGPGARGRRRRAAGGDGRSSGNERSAEPLATHPLHGSLRVVLGK